MADQPPFYTIDGRKYHRVTAVLKAVRNEPLELWRGKIGNKEANAHMRASSKHGTRIHAIIQEILGCTFQGFKKAEPQEVKNAVQAFRDFQSTYEPRPTHTELLVHSPTYGYAGTIDMVESNTITDWKSGSRISLAYWMQLAAYAQALTESKGIEISRLRVVRLDKNLAMYEVQEKTLGECEPYWKSFAALLNFYDTWVTLNGEVEEHEYTGASTTEGEVEGKQNVAGSEVPDDRARQDREEPLLGPRREDPLLGM